MQQTTIYKQTSYGEVQLGYLGDDGLIYQGRGTAGEPVGRVDSTGHIFRKTQYDERELGSVTANGEIHSHGLFEGGTLGWVEPDGVVIQGGLILGEEEVGRVEGEQSAAAGAALLLLFLPDDAEANKRMQNR